MSTEPGAVQTAIDDMDGNRLLWALGGLAYQLFHELRSRLRGGWSVAQPNWLGDSSDTLWLRFEDRPATRTERPPTSHIPLHGSC